MRNVSLTIEVQPGNLRYYDAVKLILSDDLDDWERYGSEIVESIGFLLEKCADDLVDDDREMLKITLNRVLRYIGNKTAVPAE